MDINDKTSIVPAYDTGPTAVRVKSLDQVSRDVEQRIGRLPSLDLASKHDDQVRPQRDDVRFAVLGYGGSQSDDRNSRLEVQVGDLQPANFADPQARPRQERIQVGSAAS